MQEDRLAGQFAAFEQRPPPPNRNTWLMKNNRNRQVILKSRPAVTRKIREDGLPLSLSLGVTGLNGITAYFGLLDIGQPRPGDTVVVSTAAGAVGSAVGQIAKLSGCRTVGIAGGPAKVTQCLELFGYDVAIDYKSDKLESALAAACPRGVDLYFDNTGGAISDTVLRHLAVGARVVICGTASVSSWNPWPNGPRAERHLLVKRARMQGFVIFDYAPRFEEAVARLAQWIRDGRLRYRGSLSRREYRQAADPDSLTIPPSRRVTPRGSRLESRRAPFVRPLASLRTLAEDWTHLSSAQA
jgi:NADPH-dependent curcumin reductase CurA